MAPSHEEDTLDDLNEPCVVTVHFTAPDGDEILTVTLPPAPLDYFAQQRILLAAERAMTAHTGLPTHGRIEQAEAGSPFFVFTVDETIVAYAQISITPEKAS